MVYGPERSTVESLKYPRGTHSINNVSFFDFLSETVKKVILLLAVC